MYMFSFEILSWFLSHFKLHKLLLGKSFSDNPDYNNLKIISLNYFMFMGDLSILLFHDERQGPILCNVI